MFCPKFLSPFAIALALAASPVHAAFTESVSGSTATLTEDFNGRFATGFTGEFSRFFYDAGGSNRDGAASLGSFGSMSTSFTFEPLAALTLSFWYAGAGSVSFASAASFYSADLIYAQGTNPGEGVASLQGGGTGQFVSRTFSNLVAGPYTLTFSGAGADKFKVDDVSFSVTAVPEPSTIALMLAGLSIVGFAARRNKRQQ